MENLLLKSLPSLNAEGERLVKDLTAAVQDAGPQLGLTVLKQGLSLASSAMDIADTVGTVCDVAGGACELLL